MHSKCGQQLVERTDDLTIPLCGGCRAAMQRLERKEPGRVPAWS